MLGLGGGQNLLLVVLGINTDKSGKQQQNTVVVGKRGKKTKNRLEPLRARAAQTGSGGAWARSYRRTRWTSSLRGTQSSLVSEMTGRKGRWALTLPLLLLFLLLPFLLFTLPTLTLPSHNLSSPNHSSLTLHYPNLPSPVIPTPTPSTTHPPTSYPGCGG